MGGTSTRRAASWLAWALAGLSVAMAAASVALYIAARSVQPPSSWGTGGDSAVLIFLLPFLAFPMVGALIASRRPKNPIGWICLAVGIFWMLVVVSDAYGLYGLVVRPGSVPFPAPCGSRAYSIRRSASWTSSPMKVLALRTPLLPRLPGHRGLAGCGLLRGTDAKVPRREGDPHLARAPGASSSTYKISPLPLSSL